MDNKVIRYVDAVHRAGVVNMMGSSMFNSTVRGGHLPDSVEVDTGGVILAATVAYGDLISDNLFTIDEHLPVLLCTHIIVERTIPNLDCFSYRFTVRTCFDRCISADRNKWNTGLLPEDVRAINDALTKRNLPYVVFDANGVLQCMPKTK